MKVHRRESVPERQLHAEVRRILRLLERSRRTRQQARLIVALETGESRRKAGARPGGQGRLVRYRPTLPGPRTP
jgi:hypothetical protein